jgi:hypothetical protein
VPRKCNVKEDGSWKRVSIYKLTVEFAVESWELKVPLRTGLAIPIVGSFRRAASRDRFVHPQAVLPKSPSHIRASRHPLNSPPLRAASQSPAMISRSSLGRITRLIRRHQSANRRGLAAATSGSLKFQTGEAAGIKIASRGLTGPTTTVALVAKAGTRYEALPGVADGLEKFAYKVGCMLDFASCSIIETQFE